MSVSTGMPIQTAPLFVDPCRLTREYEDRLYRSLWPPPLLVHDAEHKSAFSLSGV